MLLQPVVKVALTRVRGSAPREEGAFMLVTARGLFGTIGGGQLEYMAIDEARSLLASDDLARAMDVPLGPEIGQCCGGRVELALTVMSEADKRALAKAERDRLAAQPEVFVYGAGHVGRALALAFLALPVRLRLVDNRPEEIVHAPAGVEGRLTVLPEAELRGASKGAAHIIVTHEHALDFILAKEALERGDAAYVGMIGSLSKRKQFESWAETATDLLVCPMAANNKGDRRPEVIAAFVVAEVMQALGAYYAPVKAGTVKEEQ
ncbi:xanthine dehydrogenase accessory protein XdhC [Lentibacter algarum]|nr:xanthine dehydrogenase accessory protein XdhC [Lentibacter algarum]MBU2981298.1 xanthine dehydrogenase accessory protein XdhC [Lentibacter algarum]